MSIVVEGTPSSGIGITIEDDAVVLVVEPFICARAYNPGSTIVLDAVSIMGGEVNFGYMRDRLKNLLQIESLGNFADRAAHHALLFILEAQDAAVRGERLDMLRAALSPRAAELTAAERERFAHDGVIVRRGAVQPHIIAAARVLITDWSRTLFDPGMLEHYTQTTFAHETTSDPLFARIYADSGIASLAAALVRPGEIEPELKVQIQIRLPDAKQPSQHVKQVHVDGVSCPHLNPAELRTFTLLGGVLLSDVRNRDAGALQYVQGGHHEMSRWFREEWEPGMAAQVPATIGERDLVSFIGAAGDAIVMHHLVPHAVGRNSDAEPRIMLYFRIKHARHDEHVVDALCDPWLEFPTFWKTEWAGTSSSGS